MLKNYSESKYINIPILCVINFHHVGVDLCGQMFEINLYIFNNLVI